MLLMIEVYMGAKRGTELMIIRTERIISATPSDDKLPRSDGGTLEHFWVNYEEIDRRTFKPFPVSYRVIGTIYDFVAQIEAGKKRDTVIMNLVGKF